MSLCWVRLVLRVRFGVTATLITGLVTVAGKASDLVLARAWVRSEWGAICDRVVGLGSFRSGAESSRRAERALPSTEVWPLATSSNEAGCLDCCRWSSPLLLLAVLKFSSVIAVDTFLIS